MRIFLTFLFLLSVTVPVYAGPGGGGWKTAVRKVLGPGTSRLPATTATNVERTIQIQLKRQQAVLAASARRTGKVMIPTEGWKLPCQNMAVCSAKIKAGGFSQEDLEFNLKNDRLALRWYEIVRRDLALMLRQKEEMLRALKVTQLTHRPDYAGLIPAEAKYIFVGEEHGFAPLREAFETLVYQYQKKYPHRKIIVLTEFVFDRTLPLSEKTGWPVSTLALRYRRVSPDFRFLDKFLKRGIDVIGLEDERYFRNHQRLISPSFRQVESVYGMKQRNEHWRRIIEDVRQREPEAIFFIYTGNMHVHYRAPFTLANASSQVYVLQLLAKDLGKDLPFGNVMQDEPFAQAQSGEGPLLLQWPRNSFYRVLSGFDGGLVFPISGN